MLTGFAFPNLLLKPTDAHPALLEFLHHLILTEPLADAQTEINEQFVDELFADVRRLFTMTWLASSFRAPPDSGTRSEIQDSIALDSLYVRGKSYVVHQSVLLRRLLTRVDDWMKLNLQFSAQDVLEAIMLIFTGLNDKGNGVIQLLSALEKEPATSGFRTVCDHDVFSISPPTEQIRRVLVLLAAAPGSRRRSGGPLPGVDWASSRDFPILYHNDKFYCFNPQAVVDELPRLVSKWIAAQDKRYFDRRFVKAREGVLTDIAIDSLSAIFSNAEYSNNLYYVDANSQQCETDGILLYDDVAFVIESKAGGVSFSARRGSRERIKRDFDALVGEATRQAIRTASFIRDNPTGIFTDRNGSPLLTLNGRNIRRIYVIVPVFDSMDAFAIELADASALGMLPASCHWPWCVYINDLQLVTDILDTPSALLLYLDRRLRFNDHSSWFRVHDELDLLDYFMRRGLYLERRPFKDADVVQWQADSTELDRYFAALAMGHSSPPKPRLPLPDGIPELVGAIDNSGVPARTALASEILSLGADSQRKILEMLEGIPRRLARRRNPQCGVFTRPGAGISIWYVEQLNPTIIDGLRVEDACNKYERKANEWLSAIFIITNGVPSLTSVVHDSTPWKEDSEMKAIVRSLRDHKYRARVQDHRPGRNDLCPCGSGRKFKLCHGR